MNKKTIITVFGALIATTALAMFVYTGTYKGEVKNGTGDKTAERTISDEEGTISPAVNVMLQKPESWHQIASDKSKIESVFIKEIDGSTATIPITAELCRQFVNEDCKAERLVKHNTTHDAYVNLINGNKKNIIFVTPPSDEEEQLAKDNNVKLKMTPVALDGFVFITHKDNPVDSLTVEQIQDIYSGKIKNWKEVGGKDEKIEAYQREKNSGSQTAMEKMVMKGKKLDDSPKTIYIEGMGNLIECVAEYENNVCSIGYTYYYYMNNLYKNPDIKMIRVNDISPENENLKNGSYPFTVPYYEVMRDGDNNSKASEIYDYMISDEGQDIVELAGYCSIRGADIG